MSPRGTDPVGRPSCAQALLGKEPGRKPPAWRACRSGEPETDHHAQTHPKATSPDGEQPGPESPGLQPLGLASRGAGRCHPKHTTLHREASELKQ